MGRPFNTYHNLASSWRHVPFPINPVRWFTYYVTLLNNFIALGFLLKSELCQKCSKFRMQFCLCASNNVLHVFSLKFAFFLKYYVCEKTHFSGDLLLNEKQKKSFVSLSDEVTLIASFSYYCFVAQAGKALNVPGSNLFCRDTSPIRGRLIFFPFCFFSSLKNQGIYLKKLCMELESGEIFYTGYY